MFNRVEDDLWHKGLFLFFQWLCRNLFRIQLIFQNIVFCEVGFCNCMRFMFLDIFENVLIYFLYYGYFENQYCVFVMDGLVHMEMIV